MAYRILVVDDEPIVRRSLRKVFRGPAYEVEVAASGAEALQRVQEVPFDVVLTDLKMPGMSGLEVLKAIRILQPRARVIVITGYATVETAVEAMKEGALDYLAKPFTPEAIREKVRAALESPEAGPDTPAPTLPPDSLGHGPILGRSAAMLEVYQRIVQVAAADATVLITGESGTGKELVARAIHEASHRAKGPFVAVDCTALVETLLESELFGHVKGSFTGAIRTKVGLLKVADGGTLFLDEVSNISLTVQAKLLRALQERKIIPIGATALVPFDVRLVAATNQDLNQLVQQGKFREDLYFRLNVIPIRLPPLREREGDVELLAQIFAERYAAELGKEIQGFYPDALAALKAYSFPGNVRELENLVERAVVLCPGDRIRREDLELNEPKSAPSGDIGPPQSVEELKEAKRRARERAVEEVERAFVLEALKRNNWNVSQAARETGILRPNFHAMMRKLGISLRDARASDAASPEATG
ncbi:sigma-54-dependent transcriptional regulator [Deferrisoma palaeochoriense]